MLDLIFQRQRLQHDTQACAAEGSRKTPEIKRNGFFKLEIGRSGFGLFSVSVEE
jgi:hypothetical protein